MTAFRLALVLAASLLAAACWPVTTTTPVGTTVGFTNDPALTGMWRGQPAKSDGPIYMAFYPQSDGTITLVGMGAPSKSDEGGWSVFSLKTVALGPYRYMDVQEVSDNGKPADEAKAGKTMPFLYRINGDGALVVYQLDEDAAKAAIQSKKIAGTIEEGQFGDVTLTAAPTDLDAFMQTPAARALFVKPIMILKRVK